MSKYSVTIDGYSYEIDLGVIPWSRSPTSQESSSELHMQVEVNGERVEVVLPTAQLNLEGWARMIIGGRPYEAKLDRDQGWMRSHWGLHRLEIQDLEIAVPRPVTGDGRVKAPIPGQVIDLLVALGDEVQLGQPLLILEAMKMENEIRAPRSGVIERLNVRAGQSVDLHQILVEIV